MADPFKMVIAIVAIYGMVSFAKMYFRDKQRVQDVSAQPDERVIQKMEALEERVRVLETIVTDDRRSLRREIDSL